MRSTLAFGRRRWSPFLLYATGFVSSATAFFFVAHLVGNEVTEQFSDDLRTRLLGIAAAVLCALDLWRVMTGRFGSTGLIRQTPERLGRSSHWGVMLWGLDTGTPVTTVRASALPLLGVIGVALGFGIAWSGILYAGGYLAVLCWLCFRARGFFGVSHDTTRLIRELQRVRDRARLAGVLYAGIVAWTLL